MTKQKEQTSNHSQQQIRKGASGGINTTESSYTPTLPSMEGQAPADTHNPTAEEYLKNKILIAT